MPKRARSLRVEAVVLRHSDWGEADRLLSIFSREQGKLRCVAKGVRRMRSRKAGHLQPFTRVALLLARSHDWWIVTQAETVDAYLSLREDLLSTAYAASMAELLDRFIYEEGQNQALYRLIVSSLERINAQQNPFATLRFYEIHLLELLGFRPELFQCTVCSQEIKPQDQFFSNTMGGAVCPRCQRQAADACPVSLEALKYLRHFQRSTFEQAQSSRFSDDILQEVESVLQNYLTHLLERSLNAPGFLRRIRN